MVYHCLHATALRHLSDLCTLVVSDTPAICLPNELVVHARNCRARAGVLSVSQRRPSVWNSKADYLLDPAVELNSFRRQLNTFLSAHHWAQRVERITDVI